MAGYKTLFCDDKARRAQLMEHPSLNGIDYVEVVTAPPVDNQRILKVYFIPKTTLAGQNSLSDMLNALDGSTGNITVEGGVRIRQIQVTAVIRVDDHLEVYVCKPGDFSTYTLVIDSAGLDPAYAWNEFSFKAGCPSDFDCKHKMICPPKILDEMLIDYMAKDYASFRRALIDLIPTLAPEWRERHAADLGIALVELLSYMGDHLSYYQDAVANEAYLETARQRISVRRHARLIDYHMHDGASARVFIHVGVKAGTSGILPAGTRVLTRIKRPLGPAPPGPVIYSARKDQALAAANAVFETMTAVNLHDSLNEISIHTWGNRKCCLPRGSITVDLSGDLTANLTRGDFLLFEELIGPETGLEADADPAHRQVVRLTKVEKTQDPLLGIDLTRIEWDEADALAFPLCLSVRPDDGTYIENVSLARGNLVLADQGQTMTQWHPADPADPRVSGIKPGRRPYRFLLDKGPLSFRIPMPMDNGYLTPVREFLNTNPRQAAPQVSLDIHAGAEALEGWQSVIHLLDSDAFDMHFAVETDNQGRALIRFGDNTFGMAPPDESFIQATYRVGLGSAGNVGAESLVHVINPGTVPNWPDIIAVRNPMGAWGGIEPESIDQVKHLAPAAFHAEQYRAVTEEDYARAAQKHPEVSKAMATFRWTGSWHTVFITIDPVSSTEVSAELEKKVRAWVTHFTQAGYDLEIDPPVFVPLEIEIDVCVALNHFRAHVKEVLLKAISNLMLPCGKRGFFHPDNFTFGQSLYLSRLYATIEAVEGVDSAVVTKFRRLAKAPNNELEQGFIPMGRLEVLRLDNDPNFPENGVLRLNMLGGK